MKEFQTYYKLTDENDRSRGDCQWGEGITHEVEGDEGLCSDSWIHFYDDPYLAVIFNYIHASFPKFHLWEVQVDGEIKTDRGLKFGAHKVTTIKKIDPPDISNEQKIAFAILCAKEVFKGKQWNIWADKWLSGENRESSVAGIAADAAHAAYYIAHIATDATYYVAHIATDVADIANASSVDFKKIIKKAMEIK
jgi:hypothetical protein